MDKYIVIPGMAGSASGNKSDLSQSDDEEDDDSIIDFSDSVSQVNIEKLRVFTFNDHLQHFFSLLCPWETGI